jgi:hypothetical protein
MTLAGSATGLSRSLPTPKTKMSHPTIPSRVRERAIAAHRGARDQFFLSTFVEAIASVAGRWTHASPLPVEPKVSRIANAEGLLLSPSSRLPLPQVLLSLSRSRRAAVQSPSLSAVAKARHSRMVTNASAEALCAAGRRANESPIPIASVALGGANATLGTVGVLPAVR